MSDESNKLTPSRKEVWEKLNKYGVELTPEQLNDISGGGWLKSEQRHGCAHAMRCPYCPEDIGFDEIPETLECPLCGRIIKVDKSMLLY